MLPAVVCRGTEIVLQRRYSIVLIFLATCRKGAEAFTSPPIWAHCAPVACAYASCARCVVVLVLLFVGPFVCCWEMEGLLLLLNVKASFLAMHAMHLARVSTIRESNPSVAHFQEDIIPPAPFFNLFDGGFFFFGFFFVSLVSFVSPFVILLLPSSSPFCFIRSIDTHARCGNRTAVTSVLFGKIVSAAECRSCLTADHTTVHRFRPPEFCWKTQRREAPYTLIQSRAPIGAQHRQHGAAAPTGGETLL